MRGVADAIEATERGVGGAVDGTGAAFGGAEASFAGWMRMQLARLRRVYDEWGTIALAWLVIGYFTIIVFSIIAEATRCALGFAAFGADAPEAAQGSQNATPDAKSAAPATTPAAPEAPAAPAAAAPSTEGAKKAAPPSRVQTAMRDRATSFAKGHSTVSAMI